MADLGGCTVAVVGHRLDDNSHAGRAIALVSDALVAFAVATAQRLINRPF